MAGTASIDRSAAKCVSRPRSRKPATVSASALAQYLDCSRTYIGKLEAEGVIQRQGDMFAMIHSDQYPHSSENHQLFVKRKFDPNRRATVIPIFCRYQAMVRLDNGARDEQPHAHAFRLAGEKRFEDLF